jgi:hypothetical protein
VLRIRDVYPRSRILILFHPADPGQQEQKRGAGKNLFGVPFYLAKNCTKLKIISFFKMYKKCEPQLTKNLSIFNARICHYVLRNMGLGSGIQESKSKGSGYRIRNTDYPAG